nr:PREDICTED: uncharacterized protein LOC107399007 isoform X1 [Tribolium castaneum]XP_015840130.1 PREDICTED: uncharacterized protein LOC107399007 isoform X2 [Tribolium castaneum]|eukprot:XP_015840129.1 PREDICTED: uncharacterized protein LOC107399007 isoform X1 [Tribolium castaneum]
MGTKNYYLEQIQLFFKRLEDDEHAPPAFIYGASTANQKIECWWSILRRHNAQFWMNLFSKLKEDGYFAGTFLDKSLIQFCFMDIIRDELDEICLEWNSHSISSSRNSINPTGRPFVMYNMPELYESSDYLLQVPDDEIEVVKNECTFLDKRMPCDKDIFELCNVLIEEGHLEKPSDPYNAVNLYVYLRTQILNLL